MKISGSLLSCGPDVHPTPVGKRSERKTYTHQGRSGARKQVSQTRIQESRKMLLRVVQVQGSRTLSA